MTRLAITFVKDLLEIFLKIRFVYFLTPWNRSGSPNIKNKHIRQYLPSLIWLCMTAKNLRPAKKALNYTVNNTGSLQHVLCNLRSDSYDFPMK